LIMKYIIEVRVMSICVPWELILLFSGKDKVLKLLR
jgi:hypothetical protein